MSCSTTNDHSFFGYWEVKTASNINYWKKSFLPLWNAHSVTCINFSSPSTFSDLRVIRFKPHREAWSEWHKIPSRRVGRHHLVQWFVLNSSCACEWWRPAAIVAHHLAFQVNDGRWKVKIQHGKWVGWHSIQLRDIRSLQHGTDRWT